jgi:hypothetical protein
VNRKNSPTERAQRIQAPQVMLEHATTPVVISFVLDTDLPLGVGQVEACDEQPLVVKDFVLGHGCGKPGIDEDDPQPALHRRFGGRIDQREEHRELTRARQRRRPEVNCCSSRILRKRVPRRASSAAIASIRGNRLPRSKPVRAGVVTGMPAHCVTSLVGSGERQIESSRWQWIGV